MHLVGMEFSAGTRSVPDNATDTIRECQCRTGEWPDWHSSGQVPNPSLTTPRGTAWPVYDEEHDSADPRCIHGAHAGQCERHVAKLAGTESQRDDGGVGTSHQLEHDRERPVAHQAA